MELHDLAFFIWVGRFVVFLNFDFYMLFLKKSGHKINHKNKKINILKKPIIFFEYGAFWWVDRVTPNKDFLMTALFVKG